MLDRKPKERDPIMDLETYLYDKIVPLLRSWEEPGIYAISFFVYANEAYVYRGISNFPEFSVGYNTEADCNNAPALSEKRWNFAFWRQNNIPIIDTYEAEDGSAVLLDWYRSQGIENLGWEDHDGQYDEDGHYIGKGPNGYYELLCAVSNVARRIQTEGIVKEKFGSVPILVHQLENCWYVGEATRNANPNGEADTYLAYWQHTIEEFEQKYRSDLRDLYADPLASIPAAEDGIDREMLADSIRSLLDALGIHDPKEGEKK